MGLRVSRSSTDGEWVQELLEFLKLFFERRIRLHGKDRLLEAGLLGEEIGGLYKEEWWLPVCRWSVVNNFTEIITKRYAG